MEENLEEVGSYAVLLSHIVTILHTHTTNLCPYKNQQKTLLCKTNLHGTGCTQHMKGEDKLQKQTHHHYSYINILICCESLLYKYFFHDLLKAGELAYKRNGSPYSTLKHAISQGFITHSKTENAQLYVLGRYVNQHLDQCNIWQFGTHKLLVTYSLKILMF